MSGRTATLLKRDTGKSVFLWIFAKFFGRAFFTKPYTGASTPWYNSKLGTILQVLLQNGAKHWTTVNLTTEIVIKSKKSTLVEFHEIVNYNFVTMLHPLNTTLTHFMPQVSFYTLLNIRKPEVFWSFLRVQKETSDIRCVKSCSIFPGILWDHTVATFNSKTVNFSKNYTRLKENETRGLNR